VKFIVSRIDEGVLLGIQRLIVQKQEDPPRLDKSDREKNEGRQYRRN
jgi:hypothetical protein